VLSFFSHAPSPLILTEERSSPFPAEAGHLEEPSANKALHHVRRNGRYQFIIRASFHAVERITRLASSQGITEMRRYVLINAFTSKVGNGTNMSGKPTQYKRAPLLE